MDNQFLKRNPISIELRSLRYEFQMIISRYLLLLISLAIAIFATNHRRSYEAENHRDYPNFFDDPRTSSGSQSDNSPDSPPGSSSDSSKPSTRNVSSSSGSDSRNSTYSDFSSYPQIRTARNVNKESADYLKHTTILAHLVNGIALQSGLMNGSIPVNDVIGELLHLGSVDVPSIVNIKTDQVALLTENMKKLPSELVTSPAITKLESLSIEWDKRMRDSKSIDNVKSLLKNHSYFQEAQTLKTSFNFKLWSDFTFKLNLVTTLVTQIKNYEKSPDDDVIKNLGNLPSTVDGIKDFFDKLKSATDTLSTYQQVLNGSGIFQPLEKMIELISTREVISYSSEDDFALIVGNVNKTLQVSAQYGKSRQDFEKVVELGDNRRNPSLTVRKYSVGFPNGVSGVKQLEQDVRELWIGEILKMEVTKLNEFADSLKPLFNVNDRLIELDNQLKSLSSSESKVALTKFNQIQNKISVLTKESVGAVNVLQDFAECAKASPASKSSYTNSLVFLKNVKAMTESLIALSETVNKFDLKQLQTDTKSFIDSVGFKKDMNSGSKEYNEMVAKFKDSKEFATLQKRLGDLENSHNIITNAKMAGTLDAIIGGKTTLEQVSLKKSIETEERVNTCLQKHSKRSALFLQAVQLIKNLRALNSKEIEDVERLFTMISTVSKELSTANVIPDTMKADSNKMTDETNKLPDALAKSEVIGQSVNSLRSAFVLGDLKKEVEQLKTVDTSVQKVIQNLKIVEDQKTVKGLWGDHNKQMAELDKTLGEIGSLNLNVSNLTTIGAFGTPLTALASLTPVSMKAKEKSKALGALLNDGTLNMDPTVKTDLENSKKTLDQLADLDLGFASHSTQFQSAPSVFSDLENFLTQLLQIPMSAKQPTAETPGAMIQLDPSLQVDDPSRPTQKSEETKSDSVWIIVGCVVLGLVLIASGVFICWKKQWLCFQTTVVPCECMDLDKNDEREPLDQNTLFVIAHSQTFGRHSALYATWKRQMDLVSNSDTSEDRALPYVRLAPRKYRDINIHLNPTNAVQTVRVHGNRFRTRRGTIYNVTQSPMSGTDTNDDTTGDFIRLILEDQTEFVVMCENMKTCAAYFNANLGSVEISGYTVYTESIRFLIQNSEEVLVRTIRIIDKRNKNISKTLTHYQIMNWDKNGIPSCSFEMMAMIHKEISESQSPVLVHCSTGVGPAMMFTGIDYVSRWMERDESMTFEASFKRLAEKRHHSVQNIRQIGWIHVGAVYMISVNNELDLFGYNDIKGIYNDMSQKRVGVPRDAQF